MKFNTSWVVHTALASAALMAAGAQAQIYRCGNEYLNDAKVAQARGCKVVEGGNVTIVQGTKVQTPVAVATPTPSATAPARAGATPAALPRDAKPDSAEQRARDNDQRLILESELKKAETRLAELQKEFNNGEPEKRGEEFRNHQKYVERTAELKANINRHESDVAGIKRELQRTYK
jgi:ribosome-associated protein YbcJ (S4-like RNA binding protein)